MLENKVRNQKRQLSVFNTAAKSVSDNEEPDDWDKEADNKDHSTLTRQGNSKCSKRA